MPVRRFSAQLCTDVQCTDSKLVAHDIDFYLSALEYIRGILTLSTKEVNYQSATINSASVVGEIDGESVNLKTAQETFLLKSGNPKDIKLWLATENHEVIDYCSSPDVDLTHEN